MYHCGKPDPRPESNQSQKPLPIPDPNQSYKVEPDPNLFESSGSVEARNGVMEDCGGVETQNRGLEAQNGAVVEEEFGSVSTDPRLAVRDLGRQRYICIT